MIKQINTFIQRRLSLSDKLVPRFQYLNKSQDSWGSRANVSNRQMFKIKVIF